MFELLHSITGIAEGLRRAGGLSPGARFYKCALQVNPYGYAVRHPKQDSIFSSQVEYDASMVAAAQKAGIEVVALTDHFRVATSESLRQAMEAAGIVVFPGFEASSREGVHLLCLYAPGTDLMKLQAFVGECRLRDPDADSPQSELGCEEIMHITAKRGGLTIAAHVCSNNGLLQHLRSGARIGPWRSNSLSAAAIPGTVDEAPQGYRSILKNLDPEYHRDMPLALVNASDVSDPADFALHRSWCWIKMAEPTIDGLRQAFLASDTRVCSSSAQLATDSAEITAVAWDGGFLDGQAVKFNNGLNVLIGGRGAGKSLVIESIRHVMDLRIPGEIARANHEALTKKVLGPHTRVSLLLREPAPKSGWYVVERTGANPPKVRGSDGAVKEGLSPKALIEGLEIYGQHELSELTRNKELLANLLNRYLQDEDGAAADRRQLLRQLESSREDISGRHRTMERLESDVGALPALRHKMMQMDDLGARELLSDKLAFDETYDAAMKRQDGLEELHERIVALEADLARLPTEYADSEGTDVMARTGQAGAQQAGLLRETLERGIIEIKSQIMSLDSKRPQVEERLRPIIQELRAQGIELAAYEQIANDIAGLQKKETQLALERAGLSGARDKRLRLLDVLTEQVADQFRSSERAARAAGRALEGRVRVAIRRSDDLSSLRSLLDAHVIGAGPKLAVDRLSEMETISLLEFADAIRQGSDNLRAKYGLTDASARNIAAAGEPLALKVEELVLQPAADVELNVGEEESPRWKSIDDLSAGQKATAALLLLLGGSQAPLIIDQPEDDLDNRFIADTIVDTMRLQKRDRQFVFSSHNANIPVLGDAEQIVTLRPVAEHGVERSLVSMEETGSIDQPGVRLAVGQLLEGGKEAFLRRKERYGY